MIKRPFCTKHVLLMPYVQNLLRKSRDPQTLVDDVVNYLKQHGPISTGCLKYIFGINQRQLNVMESRLTMMGYLSIHITRRQIKLWFVKKGVEHEKRPSCCTAAALRMHL